MSSLDHEATLPIRESIKNIKKKHRNKKKELFASIKDKPVIVNFKDLQSWESIFRSELFPTTEYLSRGIKKLGRSTTVSTRKEMKD